MSSIIGNSKSAVIPSLSHERDALRASILNLVLSEELETRKQNSIPIAIPETSLLLSRSRFRERRPGLASASHDLLDITQSAALAGSAPISLPSDRLAVYVAFSAEAQKGGFNSLSGVNGGVGEGEMKQRVAQQREAQRGNLSLAGLG